MKNILFIDDDIFRISSHVDELKLNGYSVNCITSVEDALKEYKENSHHYGLIILDIMMARECFSSKDTKDGRITGIILLDRLMEMDQNVPVVVLTVLKDSFAYEKAKELRVKEYLLKPKLPSELLDVVDKYCKSN